ncbi:uncharacterized protein LOC111604170 [Drosophila hydei]|uniref:Uncharacterized protein LOC111604170 n=1 Tax=Drosophila hydei TaxID=7224 RepID=A0A6J1MBF3_DROHY|nr:uncharacterized protein LOC111604170 [Drosophila hydei]
MVNVGCVAKLLSGFHLGNGFWVKRVNPHWYEARQLPKTLLREKLTANKTILQKARKASVRKNTKSTLTMTPLSRRVALL